MKAISAARAGILLLVSVAATAAWADDRSDYNARATARIVDLFQSLDRDGDGLLTRDESMGDLDLGPRFDDMDINRDGIVTREEFHRYVERRYGRQNAL